MLHSCVDVLCSFAGLLDVMLCTYIAAHVVDVSCCCNCAQKDSTVGLLLVLLACEWLGLCVSLAAAEGLAWLLVTCPGFVAGMLAAQPPRQGTLADLHSM